MILLFRCADDFYAGEVTTADRLDIPHALVDHDVVVRCRDRQRF